MKRYRILSFDFDSRVNILTLDIKDTWEDNIKILHRKNKESINNELITAYGIESQEIKRLNFIDLGVKPLSILAFHNKFFEQIRISFIMGAYYPALTATCTLGERILNHLLIALRDNYKKTPEYKTIRKNSFDNWEIPITALESWGVLIPAVVIKFRQLKEIRNSTIHFRPDIDNIARPLALEAIHCLTEIIKNQFSGFGSQPWFITNIPGEIYIKKSWESNPFIQKIYIPNCLFVGPKHKIEDLVPRVVVNDNFKYEEREISDDEFCELRKKHNSKPE